MNEIFIIDLQKYIDSRFPEPYGDWRSYKFKTKSYSNFAAYELLSWLIDRPNSDIESVIFSYQIKMLYLENIIRKEGKYENKKSDLQFMLVLAVDVAEDILNWIKRGGYMDV